MIKMVKFAAAAFVASMVSTAAIADSDVMRSGSGALSGSIMNLGGSGVSGAVFGGVARSSNGSFGVTAGSATSNSSIKGNEGHGYSNLTTRSGATDGRVGATGGFGSSSAIGLAGSGQVFGNSVVGESIGEASSFGRTRW